MSSSTKRFKRLEMHGMVQHGWEPASSSRWSVWTIVYRVTIMANHSTSKTTHSPLTGSARPALLMSLLLTSYSRCARNYFFWRSSRREIAIRWKQESSLCTKAAPMMTPTIKMLTENKLSNKCLRKSVIESLIKGELRMLQRQPKLSVMKSCIHATPKKIVWLS